MEATDIEVVLASLTEEQADGLLKLENQLCFPLYACAKEIVRRYTPFLSALDLTYTQYLVMMALWEHGTLSVARLGELLYLDSGTLTPLLKKMEAKGYVARARSVEDARRLDITLTPAGIKLKQRARAVPLEMSSCVGLTLDEGAELRALLGKILDKR